MRGGPLKSVEKGPCDPNLTDAPSRYVNGNIFGATFNWQNLLERVDDTSNHQGIAQEGKRQRHEAKAKVKG